MSIFNANVKQIDYTHENDCFLYSISFTALIRIRLSMYVSVEFSTSPTDSGEAIYRLRKNTIHNYINGRLVSTL